MTAAVPAAADGKGIRNASLGTLFLTVFLDLLGFGLVIPFLPGIARRLGAGDFLATLPGAVFSVMQFLFIPIWGRLSDRVGRRPVLLWSIAASAIGMATLGFAPTLIWLFVARIWSGIATANIAVAQAYIADVTTPERRARGMAIVGISFGLGFIFGPFIGGELSRFHPFGREGMLPPLVAAGLSIINLLLAFRTLPESLPPEKRGRSLRRASPIDLGAFRAAISVPGIGAAVAINFMLYLWFSGMEQTFRLFTADGFGMSDAGTGRVFGLVGIVSALVQGGLVARLVPRFGEGRLIQGGLGIQALAFALLGFSPLFGASGKAGLLVASALIALGSGLCSPTLPAFASRRASATTQGMTLGTLQSASALARALGPIVGGALYAAIDPRAPYLVGAVGLGVAMVLAMARLR
ncbi:MAG TPA: MFS transporter [Polyangia bacterium]|jgi:MFS family permease|nr:MFS transporter [Polyangia bacterium]